MDTYLRLRADLLDLDTGYSGRNLGKHCFENLGKHCFENLGKHCFESLGKHYFESCFVPGNWTLIKSFTDNLNAHTDRWVLNTNAPHIALSLEHGWESVINYACYSSKYMSTSYT